MARPLFDTILLGRSWVLETLCLHSALFARHPAMLLSMQIEPGIILDDDLAYSLVTAGREGHRIAQAHNNDPGSNGYTFGTDRYHRSTELVTPALVGHGFKVSRHGAGLVARKAGLELQFAVARGDDLTDPANFDANSSPARNKAAVSNTYQLTFDGVGVYSNAYIVHIVWSGNRDEGLTAVNAGRLMIGTRDRLVWSMLVRLDEAHFTDDRIDMGVPSTPSYVQQPEPSLSLEPQSDNPHSHEA